MHLFGYGSLMWKYGFEPRAIHWDTIDGFSRRFYQHSTDHRGTPQRPGRVVTLIQQPQSVVFGVVLEVPDDPELLPALDHREKDGYERLQLVTNRGFEVITYVAPPDNPGFLGGASIEEMALQIASAVGPSGANSDYLFDLENILKQHGVDESHVFELAAFVRDIL